MKIILLITSFISFSKVCTYDFGRKIEVKENISKSWTDQGMTYSIKMNHYDSDDNYITVKNSKYKVTYQVNCDD